MERGEFDEHEEYDANVVLVFQKMNRDFND